MHDQHSPTSVQNWCEPTIGEVQLLTGRPCHCSRMSRCQGHPEAWGPPAGAVRRLPTDRPGRSPTAGRVAVNGSPWLHVNDVAERRLEVWLGSTAPQSNVRDSGDVKCAFAHPQEHRHVLSKCSTAVRPAGHTVHTHSDASGCQQVGGLVQWLHPPTAAYKDAARCSGLSEGLCHQTSG